MFDMVVITPLSLLTDWLVNMLIYCLFVTISAECPNELCGKTGSVDHGVCNVDEDSYNCTCNPGFAPASPNHGPRDRVHYCMSKFFTDPYSLVRRQNRRFRPYRKEYGSVKPPVLAYLMQWEAIFLVPIQFLK